MKKALTVIAYLLLALILTVFVQGELKIRALHRILYFSNGVRVFGIIVVVGIAVLLTLKLLKGGKEDEPTEETHQEPW